MKLQAIINTQALGDCLLGVQLARLLSSIGKRNLFVIRSNFLVTTRENENVIEEVLDFLSMQTGVDYVGLLTSEHKIVSHCPADSEMEHIWYQTTWNGMDGILKSALKEFSYRYAARSLINSFIPSLTSTNISKEKSGVLLGLPIDWERKLGIKELPDNVDILEKQKNITELANTLSKYKVFISPIGATTHMAAMLGCNTITFPCVYPAQYDCPEFYMNSGVHLTYDVSSNHCRLYKCLNNSFEIPSQGPPGNQYGFWPTRCDFTKNKIPCTLSYTIEDIKKTIEIGNKL